MLSPEYVIKSSKLQTKLTAQQPFDQVAIHSQMPATLKEDVHMHIYKCRCSVTGVTGWQGCRFWLGWFLFCFVFLVTKARQGALILEQPGSDCRIVKEMLKVTHIFM